MSIPVMLTLDMPICNGGSDGKVPSLIPSKADLNVLRKRKISGKLPTGAVMTVYLLPARTWLAGGGARLYNGNDKRFFLGHQKVDINLPTRTSGKEFPMCQVDFHELTYEVFKNRYPYAEVNARYNMMHKTNGGAPPDVFTAAQAEIERQIAPHAEEISRLQKIWDQLENMKL